MVAGQELLRRGDLLRQGNRLGVIGPQERRDPTDLRLRFQQPGLLLGQHLGVAWREAHRGQEHLLTDDFFDHPDVATEVFVVLDRLFKRCLRCFKLNTPLLHRHQGFIEVQRAGDDRLNGARVGLDR